ncbi:MAG: glycosyltransferase family 10 [Elusimicrobiota bacterium]
MGIKEVAIYAGAAYANDELFNPGSRLNRDNCLAGFRALKSAIESSGGVCSTFDVYLSRNLAPDTVLFLDIPLRPVRELLGKWADNVVKCVILQEPETIIPRNWNISLHEQFNFIFTWNDVLVDDKRYFKFNYGSVLPAVIRKDLSKKGKLCAVIAGNQKSENPLALYSKREEAIRWFESHHPEEFDLYGRGWDEYLFQGPRPWRALNRIKLLKKLFSPYFPSYKGEVGRKTEVLEKYRFSVCYENTSGMPGYISEKIFDCFAAGCIPLYWGAPNVKDYIPADCFLDKREFPSYEALYERMKAMSDMEYLSRLAAIESFLNSEKGYKFSVKCFAETIVKALLG